MTFLESSADQSAKTVEGSNLWRIERFWRFLPFALCFAYFVVVLVAGWKYTIGSYDNSDFYSRYAPDAARILHGKFPEDTFTGPGYSLLLVAGHVFTGNYFVAGKWIAALSASLCGLVAYFLFKKLYGRRTAVLSLLVIFVSAEFSVLSLDPGSDLVFLLLCLGGFLVFVETRITLWQRVVAAGVLGGYAYLTRYNGVFLPATFGIGIVLLNCFRLPLAKRLQLAMLHAIAFLLTTLPWLWLNYRHNGSPFYNTNYLNVATYFHGLGFDSDGVRLAAKTYKNFGDVLLGDPAASLKFYIRSIFETFGKTLSNSFLVLPLAVLAIIATPFLLWKRRNRDLNVLILGTVLYFLVMCLNHWESRYYVFVKVFFIGVGSFAIVSAVDLATRRGWLPKRLHRPALAVVAAVLVAGSGISSIRDGRAQVRSQPGGLQKASEFLRKDSPQGFVIIARKPHLAYLAGGSQDPFPMVDSITELQSELATSAADYLVFDSATQGLRPGLKALADSKNGITWLDPVYVDKPNSLVIYHVHGPE